MFEPTFSAVIEHHPDVVDVDADAVDATPVHPEIQTPKVKHVEIKTDPDTTALPTHCKAKRAPHTHDLDAPMPTATLDAGTALQALGGAFVVGALTGALLVYAFSKPSVCFIAEE